MQRFLDLTNDLAFKKMFSYKTTLIAFLNTILDLKDKFEAGEATGLTETHIRAL